MGCKNSQGQILAEVAVIMALVVLVLFGALNQLASVKNQNHKYQFSQEVRNEKASRTR